jgi:site-specific DNA-methyltransferase (adenine-specific)
MMRLILGDSREELAKLEPDSMHALVCDPPAGIEFMGKSWDAAKGGREQWINWLSEIMALAIQLVKPGGHGLVWALPRTSHWTMTALENAGWEIRDVVCHIFGSGFPKSLDVSKAIDGAAGAEREKVPATGGLHNNRNLNDDGWSKIGSAAPTMDGPAPATPDAQRWQGWGTALKPSAEFWILVRKPLAGTVAANVLAHGTGGINVEGCRVGTDDTRCQHTAEMGYHGGNLADEYQTGSPAGRWPPHLLLSHAADCGDRCAEGCPVREMDEQSGESSSTTRVGFPGGSTFGGSEMRAETGTWFGDSGGSSRFFPRFRYQPKPSRAEREAGCEHLPARTPPAVEAQGREDAIGLNSPRAGAGRTAGEVRNHHPTLKSIELMRWLCRLITPPGGIVLDPFMGSGTTGCACVVEGFDFIGIEQDPEYVQIARARIEYYSAQRHEIENDERPRPEPKGQQSLW